MGEYQYYEFQAVDRPLDESDREALGALSTRARITATSFANHYDWGDFKGEPLEFMARWFDLQLYLANRGTRQFMVRLPKRLADRSRLDSFLDGCRLADVLDVGEWVILDIFDDSEPAEDEDWDDGSGWLAALAPLRADLLSGDWRMLYLPWLAEVDIGDRKDGETEPLPGIGPLTGALRAFAEFFRIDSDLVQAASEAPAGMAAREPPPDAVHAALAAIPEDEKTELLLRLVEGDPIWPWSCAAGYGRPPRLRAAPNGRLPGPCPIYDGARRPFAKAGRLRRRSGARRSGCGGSGRRRRRGARGWPHSGGGARPCGARSKTRSPGATPAATTGRRRCSST